MKENAILKFGNKWFHYKATTFCYNSCNLWWTKPLRTRRGRTRPNTRYYIQVFLKTNLYFSPDTKLKNSLEDTRKERERETNRHEREKSPSSAKTAGKDGGTKQANETGWKMEMETIAAKEQRDWKLKMERAIRRSKQEGDGETGEERERETQKRKEGKDGWEKEVKRRICSEMQTDRRRLDFIDSSVLTRRGVFARLH